MSLFIVTDIEFPPRRSVPRTLVLLIGTVEALIVGLFIFLMLQSSDLLGRSIGLSMAKLAALPLVVCGIPGLVLGLCNGWLPAALALLLLAIPTFVVLWLWHDR